MKRIFLLIPTLLIILFSTCKKDTEEECSSCQFEQGFDMVKDWMYFKTGSYWIYEEENSGAIDTITVWEDWEGTAQDVNDAFYSYTESSCDGYFYRYRYNSSFSIHCLTEEDCRCEKVDRSKSRPGDYIGQDRNFVYPPILNNYSAAGSDITEVIEIEETYLTLNGDTSILAVFDIPDDLSEDGQHSRFSVVQNVGIVKKELLGDGQVWNLIEYKVTQ